MKYHKMIGTVLSVCGEVVPFVTVDHATGATKGDGSQIFIQTSEE